ncbi:MAG: hypothetical protein K2N23_03740 [Clostridia bacterium]|nr:hypothetical protein [Clostridia bacterium]
MHRGFNYYYREGLKTSGRTVYRNKCFFRYILYFLAEFFGRIFIIFNPHFNIANMRQGYVIRKKNQLNIASAFRNVGHRVSIWTYVLTLCLEGLIIIAGIVAASALAAILGGIGYAVSKIASYDGYLLILLFAAPAALIMIMYVMVSFLIFSPTAYIMANNEGVSAGETIGSCYRTMINNGKMTVFLTYFVSGLLKLLYLGAMGAGGYFLLTRVIPNNYFTVTLIALIAIMVVGYLTFAPILTLTNRVVKEHLFEDIVLDPVTAARINEKVNISVCNGQKTKPELASGNLASLFEYTEDPYRILETTERKAHMLGDSAPKPIKKKKVIQTKKEEIRKDKPIEAFKPTVEPQPVAEVQPSPVQDVAAEQPTVNPQPAATPASQQLN